MLFEIDATGVALDLRIDDEIIMRVKPIGNSMQEILQMKIRWLMDD